MIITASSNGGTSTIKPPSGDTPCSWNCPGDPTGWPCGSLPCTCRHVDINGDGQVWTEDFLYVFVNFLKTGEQTCCPEQRGTSDDDQFVPLTSITVAELVEQGDADAARADLNGDGVLDADDIAAFLMGARPAPRPRPPNGVQLGTATRDQP